MASIAGKHPPGPQGKLFTGNLKEFHKDILGFYTRLARDYGDCVRFRLAFRKMVLINHPDLIEQVLVSRAKSFGKLTYVLKLIQPLLGNGLLTSDGDFWLRQRRLIQPIFQKQQLNTYADPIVQLTRQTISTWQDQQQKDMYREMLLLTRNVTAKILFDANLGDDVDIGSSLEVVMHNFLNRWGSFLPLPSYFPTPGNLRLQRSIRELDQVLYHIIAERRTSREEKNDLLSVLLRARDQDDGQRMTDKQLRDEAMTLFLAGHETTANAMAYTWYLLARHPEVAKKLQAEIDQVLGDRLPTSNDISRLKYTEQIILESMRLYPPAYGFARYAKHDLELGGYHIPAGATVLMVQWVMHRDERFWPNADQFQPERWDHDYQKSMPKFTYFPFGGGARTCIGNTLAMMELVLMLATMAQKFSAKIDPQFQLALRPAITMTPTSGVPVTLQART